MRTSIFELTPNTLNDLFGSHVDDDRLKVNASIYKQEVLEELKWGSKQKVIDLLKISRELSDFDQLRIFFAFGDIKWVKDNLKLIWVDDPNYEKAKSYLDKMSQ